MANRQSQWPVSFLKYAFDSLMGCTTGMDMMTENDVSLPGIKPSTPNTYHTTSITTITTAAAAAATTTTTYGHWQEGEVTHPPSDSWGK
jgi:hypothetical protein